MKEIVVSFYPDGEYNQRLIYIGSDTIQAFREIYWDLRDTLHLEQEKINYLTIICSMPIDKLPFGSMIVEGRGRYILSFMDKR